MLDFIQTQPTCLLIVLEFPDQPPDWIDKLGIPCSDKETEISRLNQQNVEKRKNGNMERSDVGERSRISALIGPES